MASLLYNTDYLAWLAEQINYLKDKRLENLDCDYLISELEGIGKSDRRSLASNLMVLLAHLLKWKYQPEKLCGSGLGSIKEHRRRCLKILDDSPSLRNYLVTILEECYADARDLAATETELSLAIFPVNCPFEIEEILNPDFLPELTNFA
ncbi:DUF29 domain-containing protein [Oscillatoria salina]|uniref:DUF29 domain-containing protein n=1 Tax=Oscillatoria salina TaxID=331517 RepID=UPI0013B882BC|nr:DUF29 domain-containing protein [Oscillatoria salina]MBZ8178946.1 DUF29 domain-containing protein [Oscillatoria salina IIICB1]NET89403.1 DUF29 domain-containing protein [Kamptonema sp. SIO1D9]